MGREIRMVPADWVHPQAATRYSQGKLVDHPCFDKTLKDAQREWDEANASWNDGTHPDRGERKYSYIDWAGDRPNEDDRLYYRPAFTSPADHFQVYETVSEGTPTSPVFPTRTALADWLVETQGYSRGAADAFSVQGWAPSMIAVGGQFFSDIESADK